MKGGWIIAGMALATVACGKAPTPGATSSFVAQDLDFETEAAPSEEPTEAAPPAEAVGLDEANELFEFSYGYPAVAAAIPDLKAELDARSQKAKTALVAEARSDKAESAKGDFPYHPHSYGADWKVVTDLPDWLSLSADIYTFSGGAHGMSYFDTLLWDRRAGVLRQPVDLFSGKAALSAALKSRFCAALDKEREQRRGEAPDRGPDAMFWDCIDPAEQTVILGSSNGRTIDRIGVLIAPYSAGPYVEGTYEITLPVDGAVMKALRPQYRASFSVAR